MDAKNVKYKVLPNFEENPELFLQGVINNYGVEKAKGQDKPLYYARSYTCVPVYGIAK